MKAKQFTSNDSDVKVGITEWNGLLLYPMNEP